MRNKILLTILIMFILVNISYGYNPQHLEIFKNYLSGMWQKWRKQNPSIRPDLSNAVINFGDFNGDYSNVNLKGTTITGGGMSPPVLFFNSDLSYCTLKDFQILWSRDNRRKTVFKNTTLYRIKMINVSAVDSEFINVNMQESVILNSKINSTIFKNINFKNVGIENSELWFEFSGVDFSYSKIIKTIIHSGFRYETKLLNIKFNHAKIHESTIAGWLYNVSFLNTDLSGSSFYYLNFPDGSILTNVNFTNANLTNVNFQKAKFQNVIFKNADMTGAKLERKWVECVKKQGVRNFDKIQWM